MAALLAHHVDDAVGLVDIIGLPHLEAVGEHEVLHAAPGLEKFVVRDWLGPAPASTTASGTGAAAIVAVVVIVAAVRHSGQMGGVFEA